MTRTSTSEPALDANLPERLAERLKQPLPGAHTQARFQPELSYGRHFGPAPADARPAAVLVLLYLHERQWYLPLTLRPTDLPDHPGQISLPGGLIEVDERSQDAALRELSEELGVGPGAVELLGELSSLYLFASNFLVSPWVAVIHHAPQWAPNPAEVAELLELPLSALLQGANVRREVRRQNGLTFTAPCFAWQHHRIWGVTSMILAELAAVLCDAGPGSTQSS